MARQQRVKAFAHSPHLPRRVCRSFSGSLYLPIGAIRGNRRQVRQAPRQRQGRRGAGRPGETIRVPAGGAAMELYPACPPAEVLGRRLRHALVPRLPATALAGERVLPPRVRQGRSQETPALRMCIARGGTAGARGRVTQQREGPEPRCAPDPGQPSHRCTLDRKERDKGRPSPPR